MTKFSVATRKTSMVALLDVSTAAELLGLSRQRVLQLIGSDPTFPKPVAELRIGRVWAREDVEAWAAATSLPRHDFQPDVPPPGSVGPALQVLLELASEEAEGFNHAWIGVEHLLLALLRPECPGASQPLLELLGFSLDHSRSELAALSPPEVRSDRGQVVTPAAQLALERAKLEALNLRDAEALADHLLLALLAMWPTAPQLRRMAPKDIDPEFVREKLVRMAEMAGDPLAPPVGEPELMPNPLGVDPRRARPWGSVAVRDSAGRTIRRARHLIQYAIDCFGYPVFTIDGVPVAVYIDDDTGRPVLNKHGNAVIRALDVTADLEPWLPKPCKRKLDGSLAKQHTMYPGNDT